MTALLGHSGAEFATLTAGLEELTTTPSVGVVVCAYTLDRFADIERAIASLQVQCPAPDQIVLVIDHNDDLLARAAATWPAGSGVEIVPSTGSTGLSGARNTGIDRCSTDIVAFLDDDAAARPGWLAHLCAAYADPAVAATGGRAVPAWPAGAAPATLPPELLWVVGCTYEGQPTRTADVRNVMGCSMSFRASVLREVGGFVDGVGRTAELPLGCEETEICIRVAQHDPSARIVFEPESVVDHRVSPDRLTWGYLRRRSYAEGVSKVAIGRLVGTSSAMATERAYLKSVLPRGVARDLRRGRLTSGAAVLVSLASFGVGYLRALLHRA